MIDVRVIGVVRVVVAVIVIRRENDDFVVVICLDRSSLCRLTELTDREVLLLLGVREQMLFGLTEIL